MALPKTHGLYTSDTLPPGQTGAEPPWPQNYQEMEDDDRLTDAEWRARILRCAHADFANRRGGLSAYPPSPTATVNAA
jgi:hypothetical protein